MLLSKNALSFMAVVEFLTVEGTHWAGLEAILFHGCDVFHPAAVLFRFAQ